MMMMSRDLLLDFSVSLSVSMGLSNMFMAKFKKSSPRWCQRENLEDANE
jgi:hypothetical protein